MNIAMISKTGLICPVKNCCKKKNRKFSVIGLAMHMKALHPGEFEKKVKT